MPDRHHDPRSVRAAAIADRDPHVAGAVDADRLLGRMPSWSVRPWGIPVERNRRIAAGGVYRIGGVRGLVCRAAIVDEDVDFGGMAWRVDHVPRIACRVQ